MFPSFSEPRDAAWKPYNCRTPLGKRRRSGDLVMFIMVVTAMIFIHIEFPNYRRIAWVLAGDSSFAVPRNGWPAALQIRHGKFNVRRSARSKAVPDVWKAGPAEMTTGQGFQALYLLKEGRSLLFESAVEQELSNIQAQRAEDERSSRDIVAEAQIPPQDALVLRKRMGEVRKTERVRIATDLLYLKVCAKFRQVKVPLIPPIGGSGAVRFGPLDLNVLTSDIYSADALEVVRDHLFQIVGQQGKHSFMEDLIGLQMALFQVGQVYAMSALFGYYLRRFDARFQLEKLGMRPDGLDAEGFSSDDSASAETLKDYISKFGPEDMARMTNVASLEAQLTMERQVSALFGDLRVLREKIVKALGVVESPDDARRKLERSIQSQEVESIRITSEDLRRLVLEAVAFGSFLVDCEKEVDSNYELTPSTNYVQHWLSGDEGEASRYLAG